MKRLVRLFYLLLLPWIASSQKPCYFQAKVVDAQTGDPIQGAVVRLDGLETFLISDSVGTVRFGVKCGEHNFSFSVYGYKPYSYPYDIQPRTKPILVKMENILTQLEEIVISGQSDNRNLESPSLGVSILNLKAVQKLPPAAGEVDILRSLQNLPGVSAVGEGANGINIRGGSVDQNLIFVDQTPIFNPTHLLGLFSLLPTDGIREMQLYKGSIPAKYGGRNSSVLDIKLADPSMDQFKLKGGIGMISNRLHTEIPIVKDKMGWMFSSRFSFNEYLIRFYNNVLLESIGDRRIPNNEPVFFDLANKFSWRLSGRDNLSFTSYISYDSYRIDSLFSIAGIVPKQATMRYGHINWALRYNHYFSPKLNLNILATRSDYKTSTFSDDLKIGFRYKTNLLYHNAKAEWTYSPNSRHRINTGVSLVHWGIRPAHLESIEGSSIMPVDLQRESALESALYFSDEYEWSSKTLIEWGLRAVHFGNFGPYTLANYEADVPRANNSITGYSVFNGIESNHIRLEPRIGLRHKLNSLTTLKAGYNRMNQFIHMISNLSTPLPNVRWKTSNQYTLPAQSDLVTFGLFKDGRQRKWEWSLEGYYRWQRNIFDYINGAELNISTDIETQLIRGRGKSYGVELMMNKKKGIMTGWTSYTFARTFQQITGDFPSIQQLNNGNWYPSLVDRPHTLNTLINFQTEKHNAISFTFTYSTGRPFTAPVSFYRSNNRFLPIFADRHNGRISDYHRLDFSWIITNPSMKERKWEGSWVVTIYNLYGRKNAFSYYFNSEQPTFKPFKISVFPSPIFSLTYNFKFEP
jgi:hypothetical protein